MGNPSTSAALTNALSQRFAKQIKRQANRVTQLASELPTESSAEQGNGKNVAWDVELDGQGANAFNEGTDMASGEYTVDPIVPATLPWGLYRTGFSVTDHQFDTAMASIGSADEASMGLFGERVLSAVTKLASLQNVDLWTGTGVATAGLYAGAPNIVGLLGGALATSGTYAGIAVSGNPSWASNVLANGGVPRPLTFDLLAQLESLIFNACSQKPDLIVMSTNVWRKYSSLFEPERRFNDSQSKYDTSVDTLEWRGIRIVRDKDAPEANGAGCLVMLNKQHIKKVYLAPSRNSAQDVFKVEDKPLMGGDGDGNMTATGFEYRIIPIARTGDYSNFMVKCTTQLKVTRRNAMGYIADIQI